MIRQRKTENVPGRGEDRAQRPNSWELTLPLWDSFSLSMSGAHVKKKRIFFGCTTGGI